MTVRVGIPRGLLYYHYGAVWEDFFRRLGAEPVVSAATTQATVEAGGALAEVCLPVRVFFGHALGLAGRVDYLFSPRVISAAKGYYSCPKIIGLPDLLRGALDGGTPLLAPEVNLRAGWGSLFRAVIAAGAVVGRPALASLAAWRAAWMGRPRPAAPEVAAGGPRVVLAGHPYIVHDRYVSMGIMEKLAGLGVGVATADAAEGRAAELAARAMTKDIFWYYSRGLAGAALAAAARPPRPDGMIFLTSFACGPDSLVGEMLGRRAGREGVPFLMLPLDEHMAEAGFVTRLEAFVDMLRRRTTW